MFAKIVYLDEIRLFKLDQSTFDSLHTTLSKTFKTPLPLSFGLFFRDDSNDLIEIGSFEDIEFLSKNAKNPLKLFIKAEGDCKNENPKKMPSFEEIAEEKKLNTEPKNEEPKTTQETVFHGVVCDSCSKKPIVGVRFKCLSCENFDLCPTCEEKGVHAHHIFAKIRSPQQDLPGKSEPKFQIPEDIFKMAAPFIQNIQNTFKDKKCPFKGFNPFKDNQGFNPFKENQGCNQQQAPGCKDFFCGQQNQGCNEQTNTKKPEESEEERNKKIEEIAQKITELFGTKLEDNRELVKSVEGNLELNQIINLFFQQ